MEVLARLRVPGSFSLSIAVCSYGFYMMQPNNWRGDEECLERPLLLRDERSVMARVWQENECLAIGISHSLQLDEQDCQYILAQVKRMLRLSDEEDTRVDDFHALHPRAKDEGFGRLFRSPTLFEDMVKSILLCNCGWGRTLQMCRSLCELQYELKGPPTGDVHSVDTTNPAEGIQHSLNNAGSECTERTQKKRKSVVTRSTSRSKVKKLQRSFNEKMDQEVAETETTGKDKSEICRVQAVGAFPTPEELADLKPEFLSKRCGLGYRTKMILRLATDITSGALQLNKFEGPDALKGEPLRAAVLGVYGFGPYCAANLMMLLGNYEVVPADTETIRHLKHFHGMKDVTKQNIAKVVAAVYEKYKPFEFLAYWWEMWRSYEERFGDLRRISSSQFHLLTGLNMKKLKTANST